MFLRRSFQRFSRNKLNSLGFVSIRDRFHVSAEEKTQMINSGMTILISWRETICIFIMIARLPPCHSIACSIARTKSTHYFYLFCLCPRNSNEFLLNGFLFFRWISDHLVSVLKKRAFSLYSASGLARMHIRLDQTSASVLMMHRTIRSCFDKSLHNHQ